MEFVNLEIFWPWGLLVVCTRALIIFLAAHVLMPDRFHPLVTLVSLLSVSAVYRYITDLLHVSTEHEIWILIFYYVMTYGIILLVKRGSPTSKLLHMALAFVLYQVGTALAALPQMLIYPNAMYYLTTYEVPADFALTTLLFTLLCSVILAMMLRAALMRRRGKVDGYRGKYGFFVLFPLSHLLCGLLFFRLAQSLDAVSYARYIGNHRFFQLFVILVFCLCLILDFSIFFIIDRMEKAEQKNVQNEKLLLQNQMDYESTMLLREEKREFQKVKHDFANILTVAQGYIEIGNTDKALAVLSSTQLNLSGISGFSLCASETLNVIFYIKTTQAANIGVKLDSEIREDCGIRIDDSDLCRVLFNLIDNCLHAVERLKEDKSFHISVLVTEAQIAVHTRNRFLSAPARAKKEYGHGNGVGIIREICAKYGGSYAAHTVGDMYYTDTVMQNRAPTDNALHILKK